MRVVLTLTAEQSTRYNTEYHHKLRGCIAQPLKGTEYAATHGSNPQTPSEFTVSNIFPWENGIVEGSTYKVIVASPIDGVLAEIAEYFQHHTEFNVGEMRFTVTDVSPLSVDAGEPGTTGFLTTATGVLVRIHDDEYDEYGINPDGTPPYRCWESEYTIEPFIEKIEQNLAWKHEYYEPEYLPGPTETEYDLFTEYDFIKTYGLDLEVTTGTEVAYIVSKWNFAYEVQDDHHRRHLNLALNTGIGERNGMGLGFLNPIDRGEIYPDATGTGTVQTPAVQNQS